VTLSVDAKDCIVYVEGQFFLVAESIPCLDADDVDSAGNSHRADASRRRIRGTEPDPDAAGFVRVMRRQRAGDAGETDLRGCARETTPPTNSEASRTARVPTNDRSTTPSVASPRSVSVPALESMVAATVPCETVTSSTGASPAATSAAAAPAAVRLWVSERHCSCR